MDVNLNLKACSFPTKQLTRRLKGTLRVKYSPILVGSQHKFSLNNLINKLEKHDLKYNIVGTYLVDQLYSEDSS